MTQPIPINRKHALVAHPFPLVVEALATMLEASGYSVTRSAEADIARDAALDLAIVAIDPEGLDQVRARRRAGGRTIMLCDDLATAPLLAAIDLVDGVLASTAPMAAVRACVETVVAGGQWLDPAAKALLDQGDAPPIPALTRRERDVAQLVAAGQRNRTIAGTLGISEGTVKMHLHNVYAKLGLESRTQLAMNVRARAA